MAEEASKVADPKENVAAAEKPDNDEDNESEEPLKRAPSLREKKKPEAFKPAETKAPAPFQVVKGKGKALDDLPLVKVMLERYKGTDDVIIALHRVLFGREGKVMHRKRNIRDFSGSPNEAEHKKLIARLEKFTVSILKTMAQILTCLPEEDRTKEGLQKAIAEFLQKPKANDTQLPPTKGEEKRQKSEQKKARKEAKSKQRAAKIERNKKKKESKSKKNAAKKKQSAKKKEDKANRPKRAKTSYMCYCEERRPEIMKKHPEMSMIEVTQKLGREWGRMDDDDKKPYVNRAEKDKERVDAENAKLKKKGGVGSKKKATGKKGEDEKDESSSESGEEEGEEEGEESEEEGDEEEEESESGDEENEEEEGEEASESEKEDAKDDKKGNKSSPMKESKKAPKPAAKKQEAKKAKKPAAEEKESEDKSADEEQPAEKEAASPKKRASASPARAKSPSPQKRASASPARAASPSLKKRSSASPQRDAEKDEEPPAKKARQADDDEPVENAAEEKKDEAKDAVEGEKSEEAAEAVSTD